MRRSTSSSRALKRGPETLPLAGSMAMFSDRPSETAGASNLCSSALSGKSRRSNNNTWPSRAGRAGDPARVN